MIQNPTLSSSNKIPIGVEKLFEMKMITGIQKKIIWIKLIV